ncbi:MAG: DUF5689 domain-containing protein [Lachnoclostridium sp.]|nr:DUF5689 domain-containing protein [Lachnoclostridium sp.]
MKNIFKCFGLIALGLISFSACQDDVDDPAFVTPKATLEANTTIAEVKTTFWSDDRNYNKQIGLKDEATGEHYIISGRVISSDAAGNVYKSLIIQDETAAIAMSINANSLYTTYREGQEIVLDLTNMYIGKYNGLQQLGFPQYTEQYGWETTFMPKEFFVEQAQLNGLPDPEACKIIPITGADLASGTTENLVRLQSQLVRINDCYFEEGGKATFTDGSKVTSNRVLKLADGTSLNVRTSGYSNFWGDVLPEGHGDIIAILSYYGTEWQLMLNSVNGCINFGNPTANPGSEELPYTVGQAIEVINSGSTANDVWTTGYIVGAVAPGVSEITSNADIEFTDKVSLDNTLVIAADPAEKDFSNCLTFTLPQGSALRKYGNLLDNPTNYGKLMTIKGNLGKYLAAPGITGITGEVGTFTIDGVEITDIPSNGVIFEETFASGIGQFTINNVTLPSQLTDIWKHDSQYKYMIATGYANSVNYDSDSWLISPNISLKGVDAAYLSFEQAVNFFSNIETAKTQATVAIREVGSSSWTTLTIPSYPSSMSWTIVATGDIDLSAFVGKEVQIGFHYTSTSAKAGTWEVKNVAIKTTGSSTPDTPDTPDTPVTPGEGTETTFNGTQFASFTIPGTTTMSGFSFDIEKNSGATAPTYHTGSSAIRLYADNTIEISGKQINKIIFTIASTNSYRYTTFTPSTGKLNPEQKQGDTQVVWEGNSSNVTFTVGHDATLGSDGSGARGQIHISAITIYSE